MAHATFILQIKHPSILFLGACGWSSVFLLINIMLWSLCLIWISKEEKQNDSKQGRECTNNITPIKAKPLLLHVWRFWSHSWTFSMHSLPFQISAQVILYPSLFFSLGFCFHWFPPSMGGLWEIISSYLVSGFVCLFVLADTVAICIQKPTLMKFVIGVWIKRRIPSLTILLIHPRRVKTTAKTMERTTKRGIKTVGITTTQSCNSRRNTPPENRNRRRNSRLPRRERGS